LSSRAVAERIEQPLLIITGDRDRLVPWPRQAIADEPRTHVEALRGREYVVNNCPNLQTLAA